MSEQGPIPELVILPRPQIAVTLLGDDTIEISTVGLHADYERLEHEEVHIPLECAAEVAQAMLSILKSRA